MKCAFTMCGVNEALRQFPSSMHSGSHSRLICTHQLPHHSALTHHTGAPPCESTGTRALRTLTPNWAHPQPLRTHQDRTWLSSRPKFRRGSPGWVVRSKLHCRDMRSHCTTCTGCCWGQHMSCTWHRTLRPRQEEPMSFSACALSVAFLETRQPYMHSNKSPPPLLSFLILLFLFFPKIPQLDLSISLYRYACAIQKNRQEVT